MSLARREYSGYQLAVIGASAGGMLVIKELLMGLPAGFSLPLAIVQHVSKESDGSWAVLMDSRCSINVKEVGDKDPLMLGTAHLAPANYHLLVEAEGIFTLTVDEPVNYARPSIDVLFETAAEAYASGVVGILLTGANADGAAGLGAIQRAGGLTIVQDPSTAAAKNMPQAGIAQVPEAVVMTPEAILDTLITIHNKQQPLP